MKARVYIIIICCLATMNAFADMTQSSKSFGQTDYDEMSSDRVIMNSQRYSSPIYEPFNNSTPSELSEVGSGANSPKGGPRKAFDQPTDPGNQSNDSPIGDALFPLMLCVLAFAGLITLRRRKIKS